MPRNIGIVDQVLRAVLGLAILAYLLKDGLYVNSLSVGGAVGAYLLATALLLYCPLYGVFGLSTCGRLDRSA